VGFTGKAKPVRKNVANGDSRNETAQAEGSWNSIARLGEASGKFGSVANGQLYRNYKSVMIYLMVPGLIALWQVRAIGIESRIESCSIRN
jgi:hypothetical protein